MSLQDKNAEVENNQRTHTKWNYNNMDDNRRWIEWQQKARKSYEQSLTEISMTEVKTKHVSINKNEWNTSIKQKLLGTPLAVKWLRIHLVMQGTWVWALIQKVGSHMPWGMPVSHSCWACAPEPTPAVTEATPRTHALQREVTTVRSPCTTWEQPPLAATRESPCPTMKSLCMAMPPKINF